MTISAAYAVPHPPLIVPSVGRGKEAGISDTINAYNEVAKRIERHAPETIVVISPHAPLYRDGFFVSDSESSFGSMANFGAPQDVIQMNNDVQFQGELAKRINNMNIPVAGSRETEETLDHATFVPLHFVREILPNVQLVRVGLSGLSPENHKQVGRQIADVANNLGRKIVIIASGDLSHKLKPDGPYGFDPAGPVFDEKIMSILGSGQLDEMFNLDEQLCDDAAECGLRSFEIMSGALEGENFKSESLSYEGPFGVGYGIAAFEIEGTE